MTSKKCGAFYGKPKKKRERCVCDVKTGRLDCQTGTALLAALFSDQSISSRAESPDFSDSYDERH